MVTKAINLKTMDGHDHRFEGNEVMFNFYFNLQNNNEEILSKLEDAEEINRSDDPAIMNDIVCVTGAYGNVDFWLYCLNRMISRTAIHNTEDNVLQLERVKGSLTHAMERDGVDGPEEIECLMALQEAMSLLRR